MTNRKTNLPTIQNSKQTNRRLTAIRQPGRQKNNPPTAISHPSKRKNNQLTAIRQRSNRKNNPLTAISHPSKRKNNQLTAIRQRSKRENNPLTAISHPSKQENKSQIVISRRRPEAWTTPMRLPKEMRRQAAKVVVALRTLASALKVPERRCRPFPPPHSPTS